MNALSADMHPKERPCRTRLVMPMYELVKTCMRACAHAEGFSEASPPLSTDMPQQTCRDRRICEPCMTLASGMHALSADMHPGERPCHTHLVMPMHGLVRICLRACAHAEGFSEACPELSTDMPGQKGLWTIYDSGIRNAFPIKKNLPKFAPMVQLSHGAHACASLASLDSYMLLVGSQGLEPLS